MGLLLARRFSGTQRCRTRYAKEPWRLFLQCSTVTASIPKRRASIVEAKPEYAFAVWITGLPASGKSTLVTALRTQLADRGIDVAVLESGVLRQIFTLHPRYDEQEREAFYRQMGTSARFLHSTKSRSSSTRRRIGAGTEIK